MNKHFRLLVMLLLALVMLTSLSQACAQVLRSGDKGDEVKQMQAALVQQGYLEEKNAKGKLDKKTVSAVKAFQANQGLEETGVADVRTLTRLLGPAALGDVTEIPPLPADEGKAVLLGIYGLTMDEYGKYATSSIYDQAVIDLYHIKEKLKNAVITVNYDRYTVEIVLTMPKGTSAKKAKSILEKAASMLGDLMAAHAGKDYEPSNAKGKRNNHYGSFYDGYSLYLRGLTHKGEYLCYGGKARGHSLAWR